MLQSSCSRRSKRNWTLLEGLDQLDAVLVLPFSIETSRQSPEAFLDLSPIVYRPLALVEGTDFALVIVVSVISPTCGL